MNCLPQIFVFLMIFITSSGACNMTNSTVSEVYQRFCRVSESGYIAASSNIFKLRPRIYKHIEGTSKFVGLNIAFTPRSTIGTTGFVIWININGDPPHCICNYRDVNPNTTTLSKSTFFYEREAGSMFNFTVTEFPSLSQRVMRGVVPSISKTFPDNISLWESTIFVETVATGTNNVSVYFQHVPEGLIKIQEVFDYVVSVVRNGTVEKTYRVHLPGDSSGTEQVDLPNLVKGVDYVVRVTLVHRNCTVNSANWCTGNYSIATSPPFRLPFQEKEAAFTAVHGYIVGVFVIVLVLFALGCFVYSKFSIVPIKSGVIKVLLLYSHDSNHHFSMVTSYASYLTTLGFSVRLDAWGLNRQPPFDWLADVIEEVDHIIIIWTESAFQKIQEKDYIGKNEPGHLLSGFNFSRAITCVKEGIVNKNNGNLGLKSILNVLWERDLCKKSIPNTLHKYYETFYLPDEFNRHLAYLYGLRIEQKLPCHYLFLSRLHNEGSDGYKHFLSAWNNYVKNRCNDHELSSPAATAEVDTEVLAHDHTHNVVVAAASDEGYDRFPYMNYGESVPGEKNFDDSESTSDDAGSNVCTEAAALAKLEEFFATGV